MGPIILILIFFSLLACNNDDDSGKENGGNTFFANFNGQTIEPEWIHGFGSYTLNVNRDWEGYLNS